ncbi:MAG: AAA family ATPase [Candidatus Entotheonellia bacterium]
MFENKFISAYTPLQRDGPLPPGINESTVKAAFSKLNLRHVLAATGVQRFTGSPEKRLRKALDDPQLRTRLAQHRCRHCGPPLVFHELLYSYLRKSSHARNVYKRLVQPAEYGDDRGKIFLDAGRFARRLESERREVGEVVAPIFSRSAEDALAQFALVFALLQPQEAYEILHPLLLMGRSYQNFFGTTLTSISELPERHNWLTSVSQDAVYPNAIQTTGTSSTTTFSQKSGKLIGVCSSEDTNDIREGEAKSRVVSADCNTDDINKDSLSKTDNRLETKAEPSAQTIDSITEESPRSIEVESASEEDASLVNIQPGFRMAEYERCRAISDSARVQRQRLGGAPELDRKAFEEAAHQEAEALRAVKSLYERLNAEMQEVLSRVTTMLSRHIEGVTLEDPTGSDPQSVARWLDNADVWLIDLDAEVQAIDRKLALLRELDPKHEIPSYETVPRVSLKAAYEILERRADDLDKTIGEARDWHREFNTLREQLADCLHPVQSKSLMRMKRESVDMLLRRARLDDNLIPLMPLFFRLLGEIEGWVTNEQSTAACRLFSEALNDAFRSGDFEYYYEITSFLSVPMLQNLLRSHEEIISRHIVLSTLYGSIVRRHPYFFDVIWSCSGWINRRQCVGDQLVQLFDTLQHLYLRDGNVHSVLRMLSEDQTNESPVEPNEATRKQEAEALAYRLANPSGDGHYFRLRHLASTRFFKPLIPVIQERRWRDVRLELVQLEHRHNGGELEFEVLSKFGDMRDLRRDHRDNLNRYIDGQIKALQDWVKIESDSVLAQDQSHEESILLEPQAAIRCLLTDDKRDKVAAEEDIGSVEWLECSISNLIKALQRNERLDPPLAFFGELPLIETLFSMPGEQGASEYSPLQLANWPSWLDTTPRSERLWLCLRTGKATWTDLLQDGIAKLILGRDRSPEEVLLSFRSCGELDAVLAAGKFPDFCQDSSVTSILVETRDLASRRGHINQKLNELSSRFDALSKSGLSGAELAEAEACENSLLEAYDDIENLDLDKAERKAQDVGLVLETLEGHFRSQQARLNELRAWLAAAGVQTTVGTLDEAERLVEETRSHAKPRRHHLLRLQELDRAGVPDRLRASIRQFIRNIDHPSLWPDRLGATNADFYIELLVEVSQDWCVMLRALQPTDVTYQQLGKIVDLLTARLSEEILAITSSDSDQAPMLTLLVESRTLTEYYKLLVTRGLLEEQVLGDSNETPAVPLADEPRKIHPWERAQQRVEVLMHEQPTPRDCTGELVQNAFDAFGSQRYAEACTLALSAWSWAQMAGATQYCSPLVALYSLARYRDQGPAYDGAFRDALGLVLRFREIFMKRSRLNESRFVEWWLNELDDFQANAATKEVGVRLSEYLARLEEAPVGDARRDEFGTLLHIADPVSVAHMFWVALTNLQQITQRGRTALLILLYELGEYEGLQRLFEDYGGERQRYLNAFIALVNRAAAEPSAKLHTAIRQNLRTLEKVQIPFKDFANKLVKRLQFDKARINVEVSEILEGHEQTKNYQLVVLIKPDESDPPLSLKIELLDSADFRSAGGDSSIKIVTEEELLLEPKELEFIVEPHDRAAAHRVALQVTGETASGQHLQEIFRFDVQIGSTEGFVSINVDELLDIYEGYDAKPVSDTAFVGREQELTTLARAIVRDNPGAVVVYGVRRLGKTSLLDEFRRRHCWTNRPASKTLFLVVPVDTFQAGDGSKPFPDLFFKLIRDSVIADPKNEGFREKLQALGVERRKLLLAGQLGEEFEDAPFLIKLREYLRCLRRLATDRVARVILVLDEFDKLLESYRKGYEGNVEELVNQLRRAATEEPDIGVVLAGSDLMKIIIGHYRSALYGSATEIKLDCFDSEAHRKEAYKIIAPERIRGRREFSEPTVDEIIQITGGHPLYMRLVGCAASHLSQRRRVSKGIVVQAVQGLLHNEVLQGDLPDPKNLVKQPLQALKLMESDLDESLGRLLLLQLARHTSLERPGIRWAVISNDDSLLTLQPTATWARLRDKLREADLIYPNERNLWTFRFPILAEALRIGWEFEFDKLRMQVESMLGKAQ